MSSTPLPNSAGRSVYLETFGCQMNVLDTQLVKGQLQGLGYQFTDDWKQADIVLYNTCSVREHAEQKVYSRIGEVGRLKKEKPSVILGVIGCMAERDGTDILRRYPQIDMLCGPGELDKVPMLIDNAVKTSSHLQGLRHAQYALQGNTHRRSATLAAAEDQLELLDLSRSFSPDEHTGSAYVRITRGCNKFCTYCVVPFTRGAEVHRPPAHIIDECKRLVDAGVSEITLLGQTVNHYHYDRAAAITLNGVMQPQIGSIVRGAGSGQVNDMPAHSTTGPLGHSTTSFADLLHQIHEQVPDLKRLRFVTSYPRDFGDDILQVMAACPRICRYLHLPVQSGSNRILKLMNRDYSIESYRELLDRARHYLPDVLIASDIIAGFPSETEEDHQATMELLRSARFKNCFIFKYSPRPGTTAYDRLPDDVSEADKRRRNNELLTVQNEVSAAIHREFVGKTVRVFVESISEKSQKSRNAADPAVTLAWEKPQQITQLTGRTDGDLIVMFDGDESMIGEILEVKITRSAPLALFGNLTTTTITA